MQGDKSCRRLVYPQVKKGMHGQRNTLALFSTSQQFATKFATMILNRQGRILIGVCTFLLLLAIPAFGMDTKLPNRENSDAPSLQWSIAENAQSSVLVLSTSAEEIAQNNGFLITRTTASTMPIDSSFPASFYWRAGSVDSRGRIHWNDIQTYPSSMLPGHQPVKANTRAASTPQGLSPQQQGFPFIFSYGTRFQDVDLFTGTLIKDFTLVSLDGHNGLGAGVTLSYISNPAISQPAISPGFLIEEHYIIAHGQRTFMIDNGIATEIVQENNAYATKEFSLLEIAFSNNAWSVATPHGIVYSYATQRGNKFLLTEITDPYGNRIRYQYDALGLPASITDTINRDIIFNYQAGKISSIDVYDLNNDAVAQSILFGYQNGLLESITESGTEDNEATEATHFVFSYDSDGRLDAITNYFGGMVGYWYEEGRVQHITPDNLFDSGAYEITYLMPSSFEGKAGFGQVNVLYPKSSGLVQHAFYATQDMRFGSLQKETYLSQQGAPVLENTYTLEMHNQNQPRLVASMEDKEGKINTITYEDYDSDCNLPTAVINQGYEEEKAFISESSYHKAENYYCAVDTTMVKSQDKATGDMAIISYAKSLYNEHGNLYQYQEGNHIGLRAGAIYDVQSDDTTYAYDARGNLRYETNPKGHTKEYVSEFDNPDIAGLYATEILEQNVGGSNILASKTEYDAKGQVTREWEFPYPEQNPQNLPADYEYDGIGRLVREFVMDGNTLVAETTYGHHDLGMYGKFLKGITTTAMLDEERSIPVTVLYDGFGNTVITYEEIVHGIYEVSGMVEYNLFGLMEKDYNPYISAHGRRSPANLGIWMQSFNFNNPLGTQERCIAAGGCLSGDPVDDRSHQYAIQYQYEHTPLLRLKKAIDQKGRETEHFYNQNKIITKDTLNHYTLEEYGARDDLLAIYAGATELLWEPIVDDNDRTANYKKGTAYEYDSLGQLKKQISPEYTIDIAYDLQGKETFMHQSEPDITYRNFYDENGNIYLSQKNMQRVRFDYDELDRLTNEMYRTQASIVSSRVYDNDRRNYERPGFKLKTESRMTEGAMQVTANAWLKYDRLGRLAEREVTDVHLKDTPGRLPDLRMEYFYNALGDVRDIIVSEDDEEVARYHNDYDDRGRLAKQTADYADVERDDWEIEYLGYNEWGNILDMEEHAGDYKRASPRRDRGITGNSMSASYELETGLPTRKTIESSAKLNLPHGRARVTNDIIWKTEFSESYDDTAHEFDGEGNLVRLEKTFEKTAPEAHDMERFESTYYYDSLGRQTLAIETSYLGSEATQYSLTETEYDSKHRVEKTTTTAYNGKDEFGDWLEPAVAEIHYRYTASETTITPRGAEQEKIQYKHDDDQIAQIWVNNGDIIEDYEYDHQGRIIKIRITDNTMEGADLAYTRLNYFDGDGYMLGFREEVRNCPDYLSDENPGGEDSYTFLYYHGPYGEVLNIPEDGHEFVLCSRIPHHPAIISGIGLTAALGG